MRIVSGRARLVVKPDKEHPFVVASDAADAAVYGTEFDVDVSSDATEVRVARGEVEVRNALGARRLWAGEVARAHVGAAPRRIERIVPVVIWKACPRSTRSPEPCQRACRDSQARSSSRNSSRAWRSSQG